MVFFKDSILPLLSERFTMNIQIGKKKSRLFFRISLFIFTKDLRILHILSLKYNLNLSANSSRESWLGRTVSHLSLSSSFRQLNNVLLLPLHSSILSSSSSFRQLNNVLLLFLIYHRVVRLDSWIMFYCCHCIPLFYHRVVRLDSWIMFYCCHCIPLFYHRVVRLDSWIMFYCCHSSIFSVE